MAGLDLGSLKDFDKEQEEKQGGGDLFLRAGKILNEDGVDVKLAEPLPNMNGRFFIEVEQWWINGKPYISPSTFGKPCPIQKEVDDAEAQVATHKDKDLKALLEDEKKLKKASAFWCPAFILDVKLNNKQEIESFAIRGGKAKIFDVGPQLIKAMTAVVLSRSAQNGTEEGITHRTKGKSIICTKTGTGLNTKYGAQLGDVFELGDEFYKNIPDVVKIATESIYPDDYLASVIGNYFYGDPILPEPKRKKSDDEEEAPVAARRGKVTEEAPATTRRGTAAIEEAEIVEDEAPATTRRTTKAEEAPTAGTTRRRSVLDSLNTLDS